MDLQSVFLTLFVLCCLVACSAKAEKGGQLKWVAAVVAILAAFSGLRAYSVGIDTSAYVMNFQNLLAGDPAYGLESGFKILCYSLMRIWKSPSFVLTVIALITNLLVVRRLWDFRKIASFPWMILAYFASFYFFTMNCLRQTLAVSVIFFATRYLDKQKYIKFLILVILAAQFHLSSLIGLAFLGMEIFQWRTLSNKQRWFIGIMFLLTPFCGYIVLQRAKRYFGYMTDFQNNLGFMIFAKTGFFIITVSVFIPVKHFLSKKYSEDRISYEIETTQTYYFIGIMINALGYFFDYMERISLPFYFFECVWFGMITKNGKNKNEFRIIIGMLLAYLLYGSLTTTGQGVFPYTFVWQMD